MHWLLPRPLPHFTLRKTKARERQGYALSQTPGPLGPRAPAHRRVVGHKTQTRKMGPLPGSPCSPSPPSGSRDVQQEEGLASSKPAAWQKLVSTPRLQVEV